MCPILLVVIELPELLLHLGPTSFVPVPIVNSLMRGPIASESCSELRVDVLGYNDETSAFVELAVPNLVSHIIASTCPRLFLLLLIPADGRGDGTSAPLQRGCKVAETVAWFQRQMDRTSCDCVAIGQLAYPCNP